MLNGRRCAPMPFNLPIKFVFAHCARRFSRNREWLSHSHRFHNREKPKSKKHFNFVHKLPGISLARTCTHLPINSSGENPCATDSRARFAPFAATTIRKETNLHPNKEAMKHLRRSSVCGFSSFARSLDGGSNCFMPQPPTSATVQRRLGDRSTHFTLE